MLLYLATFESAHFRFQAIGDTEVAANVALMTGLAEHAVQYKIPTDWYLDGRSSTEFFAEDVYTVVVSLGGCLRDGQAITNHS